jgi:hypothetical protein
MPQVHLAQYRIGLSHSREDSHRAQPKDKPNDNPAERSQSERQARGRQSRKQNQLAIAAENQIGTIRGLVDQYLARRIDRFHDYTSAPVTPNAVAIMFVAKTMTATIKPISAARRANSFISPPHISVAPVAKIPMIDTENATGPVSD